MAASRDVASLAFVAFILAAGAVSASAGCTGDKEGSSTLSREELLDPTTCGRCHVDHYQQWSGSMHAYAAEDPLFVAMNARFQRETKGEHKDFCVKCHAPVAVLDGKTTDGLNLAELPSKYRGVTCFYCHTVDAVADLHNNGLRSGDPTLMRGPLADPVANPVHRSTRSDLHDGTELASSRMCGSCHDIVTPRGAHIERTFAEWNGSLFANETGQTCNGCHMQPDETLRPVANFNGAPPRKNHAHTFAGVDRALTPFPNMAEQKAEIQALLDASIQASLCVGRRGTQAKLRVILDNVFAGHAFPSGATSDRRVWVEIIARKGEAVVYQSGVVADGQAVVDGPTDPDLWLMRSLVFDASGKETHQFGLAACDEARMLPSPVTANANDPRFFQRNVVRSFPRDGALIPLPETVSMRVRIIPVGLDVIDDLAGASSLDPAIRAKLEVMQVGPALTWRPNTVAATLDRETNEPWECVTATGQNFEALKYPPQVVNTCGR